MSLAQRIDECTTWLILNHGFRMNLLRQDLFSRQRNRAHAERRARRRERERQEEQQSVNPVRDDTHDLIARHRAWNASRARGGVRHFG